VWLPNSACRSLNAAKPKINSATLSAAMMLRHGLGLPDAAAAVESAVDKALDQGLRTRDLGGNASVRLTGRLTVELEELAAHRNRLEVRGQATLDDNLGVEFAKRDRQNAGDRADQIELATNLTMVGDGPIEAEGLKALGLDVARLHASDAVSVLRGTTAEMCDELRRRRELWGVSYVMVGESVMEQFGPRCRRTHGQAIRRAAESRSRALHHDQETLK